MINTAVVMGRLTFEPELRSTPNGVSVVRFQVAVDRSRGKDGERQADFIDCVAWRQTAEFISRYFHKGSLIAIEGSIQTQSYTDKNGQKRKQVELLANNVSFCGSKNEGDSTVAAEKPVANATKPEDADFEEIVDDDDDLPF